MSCRAMTSTTDKAKTDAPESATSTESAEATAFQSKAEGPPVSATAESLPFQAEVREVLSLVVHSLYANREVFLRELVSNASDALDRGRFLALTDESASKPTSELGITIRVDDDKRTLSIEDNGVGMTRDEAIQNLGTIAKSGSREFLKALEESAKRGESRVDLIGQFGVGFYAAFMVATRVDVHTRSMKPGAEPVTWRSSGDGTFTVSPGERKEVGTEIVLHLKEDAREFAKAYRVREVVERYSDFVHFPIRLGDEVINQQKAIWAQPKSQVTDEQHTAFFRRITGFDAQTPLARVHASVEAPVQFHALLYVPEQAALGLFTREHYGVRLYAKRVLIMEECAKVLPPYLRFMRGVVDSEDLPLNVSREMLQEGRALEVIETQLVKQTIRTLKDLLETDRAKYETFFRQFGRVLKEGVYSDWKNQQALAELALFETMKNEPGKLVTLAEYVAKMPDEQKDIYFVTGPSRKVAEASPHLEALRKRGFDVLFFVEAIDEWVAQSLREFDKRRLRSIAHGDFELPPEKDAKEPEPSAADAAEAVRVAKEVLGDRVRDVRVSKRLTDTASVLVAAEGQPGANFERLMRAVDPKTTESKRILEINAGHPFVKNLNELAKRGAQGSMSDDVRLFCELLYDEALLAEGVVRDPGELVKRLQTLMTEASASALQRGS